MILILTCDYDFAKANGTHPIGALIAPTTWFFWLVSLLILFSTFPNSFNILDLKNKMLKITTIYNKITTNSQMKIIEKSQQNKHR